MSGLLVAFEGIDGAGKSSLAQRVADTLSRKCPDRDIVLTREPWTSPAGREIREASQEGRTLSLADSLALFFRDRLAHCLGVIGPSLAHGSIVLTDRYFYSTAAYQGVRAAKGLNNEYEHTAPFMGWSISLILAASRGVFPEVDLLVWLDLDPEAAIRRIESSRNQKTAYETVGKLGDYRMAYHQIAAGIRLAGCPDLLALDAIDPLEANADRAVKHIIRLTRSKGGSS